MWSILLRSVRNMASNISNELIEMLKTALKKADPYPVEFLDELGFDDLRFDLNSPEKDRINASLAKKFLVEHGIIIND